MTIKQLEKLGIIFNGSRLYPRIFYIVNFGDFKIPENYNIEDIFQLIYDKGFEVGVTKGKNDKIKEIKKCFELELFEE